MADFCSWWKYGIMQNVCLVVIQGLLVTAQSHFFCTTLYIDRVMGTSVNLKNRFAGYKVELIVKHDCIMQMVDLVHEKLTGTHIHSYEYTHMYKIEQEVRQEVKPATYTTSITVADRLICIGSLKTPPVF